VRILGEKGVGRVKVDKEGDQSQLTVLFCGNAAGHMAPPMVLVNGKNYGTPKAHSMNMTAYPGVRYWKTPSGWSRQESFEEFILHFDRILTEMGATRPQVLIVDGVSSHLSFKASLDAKARNIEIYVIPPNSSSMVQPLDLSWMKPIKTYWHQSVVWYQRKHPGTGVTKKVFPEVLRETVRRCMEPGDGKNLRSGFTKAGIYPFDHLAPWRPENEKLYQGDESQKRVQKKLEELHPKNYEVRIPKRPTLQLEASVLPDEALGADVTSVKIITKFADGKVKPMKIPMTTLKRIAELREKNEVKKFTFSKKKKKFKFFFCSASKRISRLTNRNNTGSIQCYLYESDP
jgi:hypothetical protein